MHKVFLVPYVLKIEIKKCDAGEIPMHAYLVVCALKKVLFSGEWLNQPYPNTYLNP